MQGSERFLVEFIRTNEAVALGLTQQQWISVALFVVGIAGMWWFGPAVDCARSAARRGSRRGLQPCDPPDCGEEA